MAVSGQVSPLPHYTPPAVAVVPVPHTPLCALPNAHAKRALLVGVVLGRGVCLAFEEVWSVETFLDT